MAGPSAAGLVSNVDPGGADVVGVETADLVVLDLADIGGAGAEIGEADDGVGGRAAGHFGGRAHVLVDRQRARLVDQRHAALGHAVLARKPSSVCTSMSKIALPIPRTSYFAVVIRIVCLIADRANGGKGARLSR